MTTEQEKELQARLKAFKAKMAKTQDISASPIDGEDDIDTYFQSQIEDRESQKAEKTALRNASRVLVGERNMVFAQHVKIYFDLQDFDYSKRELSAVMDSMINLAFGTSYSDVKKAIGLYEKLIASEKHESDLKKTILNVGQLPTYSRWLNGNPIGDLTGRADSNTAKYYLKRSNWFKQPVISVELLEEIDQIAQDNMDLLAIDFRHKQFNLIHNESSGKWLVRNTEFRTHQLKTLINFGRFKLVHSWWLEQAQQFN